MNPALVSRLQQLYAAAPASVKADLRVMSGYRSPQTQKPLWDAAVKKYGSAAAARRWVAPPGKSQHGKGFAADFDHFNWSPATRKWVHEHAKDFGLHFPLKNEDWHIEVIGARTGKGLAALVERLPQTAPIPTPRPSAPLTPPALIPAAAYRQAADTMAQAGIRGIGAVPTSQASGYQQAAQSLASAGMMNVGGKPVPYTPPALNPAPVGRVEYGGPLKPATAASSRPMPPALQPAPVGAVQRAPLPPANPKPVQPDAAKQAQAYQAYGQSRAAAPATPVAPPPAPALSPKEIAAYQQYAQSRMAAPLEPVPALEVPVVKPLPPPVPVLAPKLPVPRTVRNYPVYQAPQDVFPPAPPPPPAFTPADVYAGLAPQAMSASGNMVSRDALGRTAVTNQFGATTITNAQGNQSAGSINPGLGPQTGGIGGPLGQSQGIQPQTAVKMKTMAGGALGGLVAGPVGAIVGGLLARDIATGQPLGSTVRGLLGGNNSFQVRSTPGGPVQTQKFAAPNPKLNQFPGTPMPPPGGITTPSGSNLSYSQMSSISPAAASAISRGQGGLY